MSLNKFSLKEYVSGADKNYLYFSGNRVNANDYSCNGIVVCANKSYSAFGAGNIVFSSADPIQTSKTAPLNSAGFDMVGLRPNTQYRCLVEVPLACQVIATTNTLLFGINTTISFDNSTFVPLTLYSNYSVLKNMPLIGYNIYPTCYAYFTTPSSPNGTFLPNEKKMYINVGVVNQVSLVAGDLLQINWTSPSSGCFVPTISL